MIGIYRFINRYNNKCYIGKSIDIERRKIRHFRDAFKKNINSNLYKAMRKYGKEAFDFEVLIECKEEELNDLEMYYIKKYNSNNSKYGYNMTEGGDGVTNWSEEMKENNSNISKSLWEDEIYRDKCIKSHQGKPSSFKGKNHKEETKELLRKINLGKHHSEETKKNQSEKMKGRKPSDECIEAARLANIGRPSSSKGKHRVYDDPENKKYHYEF